MNVKIKSNAPLVFGFEGPFTPPDILGGQYWQHPPTGVIESAGQITDVQDQFVSANDANQPVFANQPTLVGGVISFDGISDVLNIDAALADIATSTQGTISLWLRMPDFTTGGAVMGFGHPSTPHEITIFPMATGQARLYVVLVNSIVIDLRTDAQVIFNNTWVHLAFVQDGIASKIYVNGVLEPSTDFCNICIPGNWFNALTLTRGRIGSRNFTTLNDFNFFAGDVQQVHIYTTAATPTEVNNLYNYQQP